MNAFWAAVALMLGLGIIARLLIVHATTREESIAEQRLRKRIAEELGSENSDPLPKQRRRLFSRNRSASKPQTSPTIASIAGWLEDAKVFKDDEGADFISKLQSELILAGVDQKYSPYEALAIAIIIWIAGAVGSTLIYLAGIIPAFLYIPAVIICAVYPFTKLRSMKRNRADAVRAETIIFIMQLRMAISSGMTTIDEALARMARQAEIDPYDSILADEFGRSINQVRVGGMDWEQAMRQVSERTRVLSVENLVEALVQARRMGGDIGSVLEEYGRSASDMWQQDMRALKAKKEPMITIGMIITLFGGFLLIAGPMMISLLKTMSIVGGS